MARHNQPRREWTPEEDAELLRLHAEGKSRGVIANAIGRADSSITSRLNWHKVFGALADEVEEPEPSAAPCAKADQAPIAATRSERKQRNCLRCGKPFMPPTLATACAAAATAWPQTLPPLPLTSESCPMQTQTIPPGYLKNAVGHLVPVESIKPIDQARDALVKEIVDKARTLNGQIAEFKIAAFADIAAFVQLSAEEYNAKLGGTKGNVTLLSFDGKYKVQRAIAEAITFDERLQAAKALIDECITDWAASSRPEIQVLVGDAFQVDKAGNINTGRVLGLRRLEISDERWRQAMAAIGEAVQVVGSKSYVRVYERNDETGEYIAIPLDIAAA